MNIECCPHCGGRLNEPEIKRPEGCVCYHMEWVDPYNLPPVCDEFQGRHTDQNCTRCEHDIGCHKQKEST